MTPVFVEKEIYGACFRVVEPSSIGLPKHTTGEFDEHEPPMKAWVEGIRPDDIVIDAGASFGNYSLTALVKGAYVIAYEPYAEHATILRTNIASNGFLGRALVRPVGLWCDAPGSETTYPKGILRQLQMPLDMPTVRLDDEMPMYGLTPPKPGRKGWPQDFPPVVGSRVHIKIDTEGTELGIILGGLKLIETYKPRILIENHEGVDPRPECEISHYPERVQSTKRIYEILEGFGYVIEDVPFDVSRHFLWATHKGWS